GVSVGSGTGVSVGSGVGVGSAGTGVSVGVSATTTGASTGGCCSTVACWSGPPMGASAAGRLGTAPPNGVGVQVGKGVRVGNPCSWLQALQARMINNIQYQRNRNRARFVVFAG